LVRSRPLSRVSFFSFEKSLLKNPIMMRNVKVM
jgi:hypothetical protein